MDSSESIVFFFFLALVRPLVRQAGVGKLGFALSFVSQDRLQYRYCT